MRNHKGLALIEGILILVIVGLLAGTGWYVWNARNKTTNTFKNADQANSSAAKYSKKQTTKTQDPYAGWKEEKNTDFNYSFKYPDDSKWERVYVPTDLNSQAYSIGERVNNVGAQYTGCGRNCGLVFYFGISLAKSSYDPGATFGEKQFEGNSYYKLTGKTTVQKNGIAGTRWEYKPSNDDAASIILYYFVNKNFSYSFQINQNGAKPADLDLTEFGEKIFSTFQFIN